LCFRQCSCCCRLKVSALNSFFGRENALALLKVAIVSANFLVLASVVARILLPSKSSLSKSSSKVLDAVCQQQQCSFCCGCCSCCVQSVGPGHLLLLHCRNNMFCCIGKSRRSRKHSFDGTLLILNGSSAEAPCCRLRNRFLIGRLCNMRITRSRSTSEPASEPPLE
jgi:hypothetical protein